MFDWLFRHISPGRSTETHTRRARIVRAKYDSALTTDNNRRHWANADGLSASAANGPEVRRILRNRARYEVANNSYARGIVLTLSNTDVPNRRIAATTVSLQFGDRGHDLGFHIEDMSPMPEPR